jgi:Ribbon-helix-helix domain
MQVESSRQGIGATKRRRAYLNVSPGVNPEDIWHYNYKSSFLTLCLYLWYEVDMLQKVAFWLKAEQLTKLRAIQKEIGVPVSESIRRAIDLYLQQRTKKK